MSPAHGHRRQGVGPAAFFSSGIRSALGSASLAARAALRRLRPQRPYNVLKIVLAGEIAESEGEGLGPAMLGRGEKTPDLLTLLSILRTAREDSALGVVLIEIDGVRAGWSRLQSVRRSLLALRAGGKRVWAYLSSAGMAEYYLATAADRVILAPTAVFDATGLASEVVFVKGTLDKLGIEAQLARAGRFKAAGEPFTRTDMSPEHRAQVDALLDDLYDQLVGDVASARRLEPAAVRKAFADGPLVGEEAVRRGLVDLLAYPDEVEDALAERFGDPAPIDLPRYQRRRALDVRRSAVGAPTVGLLTVTGPIGIDARIPVRRPTSANGWRAFKREMTALAGDHRVRAIVVRVDSPGGSGLASDLMWREIVQARRRKPVVLSMGDVAASGGYYLAAAADHVTAEGGTLTGSIGVIAAKPVLRGFYDRIGVTKELVVRGNAARHSDYLPLDAAELKRLRDEAETFYATFIAKVAEGRRLARDEVAEVAEGRVWSGRQAFDRGLVDALGGIEQALDEVKRRLDVPLESRLAIDRRPRTRSWWGLLARAASSPGDASLPGTSAVAGALAGDLEVLAPALTGERVLAVMPFSMRPPARPAALWDGLAAYTQAIGVAGVPALVHAAHAVVGIVLALATSRRRLVF